MGREGVARVCAPEACEDVGSEPVLIGAAQRDAEVVEGVGRQLVVGVVARGGVERGDCAAGVARGEHRFGAPVRPVGAVELLGRVGERRERLARAPVVEQRAPQLELGAGGERRVLVGVEPVLECGDGLGGVARFTKSAGDREPGVGGGGLVAAGRGEGVERIGARAVGGFDKTREAERGRRGLVGVGFCELLEGLDRLVGATEFGEGDPGEEADARGAVVVGPVAQERPGRGRLGAGLAEGAEGLDQHQRRLGGGGVIGVAGEEAVERVGRGLVVAHLVAAGALEKQDLGGEGVRGPGAGVFERRERALAVAQAVEADAQPVGGGGAVVVGGVGVGEVEVAPVFVGGELVEALAEHAVGALEDACGAFG